jgi:hypothetical protein
MTDKIDKAVQDHNTKIVKANTQAVKQAQK